MKTKNQTTGFLKSAYHGLRSWLASNYSSIPADAGDGSAYATGRLNDVCGVSTDAAMRLSAVWACVTLLADTVSTLPLRFYRRTDDDGRVAATEHALYRVLSRQPNATSSIANFLWSTVATMLLRDAAYWEKQMSAGRVIGLKFLNRDWLSITKLADGTRKYSYSENGTVRDIPEGRIIKLMRYSLNGEDGLSSVRYGAQVFGAAREADRASFWTFLRGLMPTVVFKYPSVLQKAQREEARAMIEGISGSVNAGKPVILEAGTSAETLGINPADAQLLESRQFSAEEICSWFRVPPFMVGRPSQGQTSWGTGIEAQMIGFVTFTLRPILTVIEQTIDIHLDVADKGKYYAEFNVDGLLRGDSAARREFYASALQNGWMNRETVARLENLPPPSEGGDIYTAQSNLVPLDKLGQTSAFTANTASQPGAEQIADAGGVQATALNGAQVTALQGIINSVAMGQIPDATAAAMIQAAFPLMSDEQIADIMKPLRAFTPASLES